MKKAQIRKMQSALRDVHNAQSKLNTSELRDHTAQQLQELARIEISLASLIRLKEGS